MNTAACSVLYHMNGPLSQRYRHKEDCNETRLMTPCLFKYANCA